MPEGLPTLLIVKFVKEQLTATLERPVHIPVKPLILLILAFFGFWVQQSFVEGGDALGIPYFRNNAFVGKLTRYALCDVVRTGDETLTSLNAAIRHCDLDLFIREFC